MNKRQIFGIFFMLSFGAGLTYLTKDLFSMLELFVVTALYSLFFYAFHILWNYMRDKKNDGIFSYYLTFLYRLSVSLILIGVILGGFTYYFNKVDPYKIETYTVSNGEKTVVYNGMVHIGTTKYYDKVAESIDTLMNDGYVYLFEGVRPGTEENHEKFDKALGFKLNKDTYPAFSKLYGLQTQQDNENLTKVVKKGINVDISIDDIIAEYDKITIEDAPELPEEALDLSEGVTQDLSKLDPKLLSYLIPLNRAMLSAVVRSESIQDFATEKLGNSKLFDVILDKRNEYLVNYISDTEDKKMVITYGGLHFDGILKLLRKKDPNWKIVNVEYRYPFND